LADAAAATLMPCLIRHVIVGFIQPPCCCSSSSSSSILVFIIVDQHVIRSHLCDHKNASNRMRELSWIQCNWADRRAGRDGACRQDRARYGISSDDTTEWDRTWLMSKRMMIYLPDAICVYHSFKIGPTKAHISGVELTDSWYVRSHWVYWLTHWLIDWLSGVNWRSVSV